MHAVSQPQMATPRLIQRNSRWVQIAWDPLDCDGGFPLISYVVEYRDSSIEIDYTTVGDVTQLNFTIRELTPSTEYYFRIGRKSSASTSISYSEPASIITYEEGTQLPQTSFYFIIPLSPVLWCYVCTCSMS